MVIGFILCCWVHWGAHWGSLVSSRVTGLIGYAVGVVRFVRCRLVHWGAPRDSSNSSWVAGFIRIRSGGHRVHLVSLSSLGCAVVVVRFIQGR